MKNKPVILIGSGGHASVLFEILQLSEIDIIGVVNPNLLKGSKVFNELLVLGEDSEILKYNPSEIELVNGLGPSTDSTKKQTIENEYLSLGYSFATVIHPQAIISSCAEIDEGVQVMAGVIIQFGVKIGKSCVINTGSIIEHDCIVKDYVHIGPGAVICGSVELFENVYIGANSVIIQNIKVRENSIVGAGTTLLKDLAPFLTYTGKDKNREQ